MPVVVHRGVNMKKKIAFDEKQLGTSFDDFKKEWDSSETE